MMQYQSPYTVQHISLNEEVIEFSSLSLTSNGYYLVFWWRKIPLGHLYIEQNQTYTDNTFKEKIFEAIEPTISYYNITGRDNDYRQAFINDDKTSFSTIMDKMILRFCPDIFPEKVDISVVICTRNRSKELKICVENLLKQVSIPKEIIVVDNAPVDDSTREFTEQYELITYYAEMRPGLDIARNTGAKNARFPIVAYVDDDVKVHADWSYRVWETFQEPTVSAMTGLVIASSLETESQQIFEKHWEFNKGYKPLTFNESFVKGNVPKVWLIGAGANMAFRKVMLEKVGFFDERLDVGAAGCSGDSEIWFRILLAGGKINYNPLAVSHHEHRKEMKSLQKQLYNYMRGYTVAALVQDFQLKTAGYKRHILYDIPKYYLLLIRIGFPSYTFRYRTLWSEIKGIISGIRYFYKNKNTPRITKD
jgi:glycosyltransferase involved in cell wall biosynthesis